MAGRIDTWSTRAANIIAIASVLGSAGVTWYLSTFVAVLRVLAPVSYILVGLVTVILVLAVLRLLGVWPRKRSPTDAVTAAAPSVEALGDLLSRVKALEERRLGEGYALDVDCRSRNEGVWEAVRGIQASLRGLAAEPKAEEVGRALRTLKSQFTVQRCLDNADTYERAIGIAQSGIAADLAAREPVLANEGQMSTAEESSFGSDAALRYFRSFLQHRSPEDLVKLDEKIAAAEAKTTSQAVYLVLDGDDNLHWRNGQHKQAWFVQKARLSAFADFLRRMENDWVVVSRDHAERTADIELKTRAKESKHGK